VTGIDYTILRGSITEMIEDEFYKFFDAENKFGRRNSLARQVLE